MRLMWLSTRNDAILNAPPIAAAGCVALSAAWPDIVAGVIIAAVNLMAAIEIIGQARREGQAREIMAEDAPCSERVKLTGFCST